MSRKPHICVVGAGTMGRGIAQIALAAGHQVSLVDPSASQLKAAVADVVARLSRKAPEMAKNFEDRLSTFDRLESVSVREDVVLIEAALEDLATKQAIFRTALEVFGPECILATNTSSLSITQIAAGVEAPARVVGMHFFNPVPVMRLVEVVEGLQTDPSVSSIIASLATAWGKDVARAKSAPGFIVNRVARPFYGEALRLLEERAAAAGVIDEVLRSAGQFRMGPFELMDLIGLDVNLMVTCSVWAAFNHDPRFAPSHIQRELVAGGFLGRKSGRGFYTYDGDAERVEPVSALPGRSVPATLVLRGSSPTLEAILDRAGVDHSREDGPGALDLGLLGTVLLTRGRTAADEARASGTSVVVLDRCLDPSTVTALSLAGTRPELVDAVTCLLDRAGIKAFPIDDTPGLIVARIVSMLANEAWETTQQGTAAPRDIDTAMMLGTNYPLGPFAWAERWGCAQVLETLDALWDQYHDTRYRASRLLRREVISQLP